MHSSKIILLLAAMLSMFVGSVFSCVEATFRRNLIEEKVWAQDYNGRLVDNGVEVCTLDCPDCFAWVYSLAPMDCIAGYEAELYLIERFADGIYQGDDYAVGYRYGGHDFLFALEDELASASTRGMVARVYGC